jgi:hypothetical protein
MNTTLTAFTAPRLSRFIEPGLYTGLAVALIGRIFYFEGVIDSYDASLVFAGEIIGLMASCAARPVTAAVQKMMNGRWSGHTAQTFSLARRSRGEVRDAYRKETRRAA